MCEVNTREKMFLGKLEVILSKFDEMDDLFEDLNKLVEQQPDNQQQIDYLLSDYYHILENENVSDEEIINIGKNIHDARLKRRDEVSTASLIKTYSDNKNKLTYCPKANRSMFRYAIDKTIKHLHEEYKYRILNENDLKELKKSNKDIKIGNKLTKESIIDCFKSGMKNKDICKKFNVDPSTISRLRKKYGFPTRAYNKKG